MTNGTTADKKTVAAQFPCLFNQRNRRRCACQNCDKFNRATGKARKDRLRKQGVIK